MQSEPTGPLAQSRQLVVVTAADWSSSTGTLQRFERESLSSEWQPIGKPFPIVLGTSGLAWGRGMHEEAPSTEYRKREGDGKSPAGIFALSAVFGYAPASEAAMASRSMPYVQATSTTECVDDPASTHYNSVLERTGVPVDWSSAEHMRRDDDLYRLGVVVDHNTGPARPGAGSCIFIHIWQGPSSTTAGCTAGDPANIAELVVWLDRNRAPRLVQMPHDAYVAHVRAWKLPSPSPVLPPVD
jgi:D-alanyl-D-alanine dipeptidase